MPASNPPESFAFRVGRLLAQDGDYVLGTRTYACLSLGEPAPDGKRYKLAAAVFQLD